MVDIGASNFWKCSDFNFWICRYNVFQYGFVALAILTLFYYAIFVSAFFQSIQSIRMKIWKNVGLLICPELFVQGWRKRKPTGRFQLSNWFVVCSVRKPDELNYKHICSRVIDWLAMYMIFETAFSKSWRVYPCKLATMKYKEKTEISVGHGHGC